MTAKDTPEEIAAMMAEAAKVDALLLQLAQLLPPVRKPRPDFTHIEADRAAAPAAG